MFFAFTLKAAHNEVMSEGMPFESEPRTMRHDIHTIYELLDGGSRDGPLHSAVLREAEEAVTEMIAAATADEREITVMARGGTDSYNLFMFDPASGEYSTVEDDEVAYGRVKAVHFGVGQYAQSGRHLYIFFETSDRYGGTVQYAFNIADENAECPRRNRLVQVAEPSLEIEDASMPAERARGEQWQEFGDMTWEWFTQNDNFLKGEDLLRKVEEEIIDGDFDIDEYTTAVNCLLNPGAVDRLVIEVTLKGFAYQLKDQADTAQDPIPAYILGDTYQAVAVDFRIDEDEDLMLGDIFWHNTVTGYVERINLNYNKKVDLHMKEL